jgi:hypothetical protein
MKKIVTISLKVAGGLILLILILLFTVPVIFKKQIKAKVETTINESVNAKVTFTDYKLGFFKNFPNLSFSLYNMYITGADKFEKDTLAGFRSFDLVFNLGSLLGSSGYEVKSIIVNEAVVNAIVLKDGSANWDIMKPSAADTVASKASETASSASEGSMKILLRKFQIRNSAITYSDLSSAMSASLNNVNFSLSGDMTASTTDLKMIFTIGETTFTMDNIKYLNKAIVNSSITMFADMNKMKFSFKDNFFSVNDIRLKFAGSIEMPKDDIITDMTFGTDKTSFKTLLSLVPAVYMTDYKDLKATGDFSLSGSAKGIYSDADSTLPDIAVDLAVTNGLISYPDLPEKISNIELKANLFADGKDLDKTTVSMDKFHMELAGSPFNMTFFLKTPMSDPDFKGTMNGKIDLAALTKAVPMDSIKLSGVITMAMSMAGRLSMIEKEQYDRFSANGNMEIADMNVDMTGYPSVVIKSAVFLITPAFAQLQNSDITVESRSDFSVKGQIRNYIPYIFRNETISAEMSLSSKLTDGSGIMAAMGTDTTATKSPVDTASLSVIAVPKNIDIDFEALIGKFTYDNINADNVKCHIIVKDGILSLRDAGMNILGGAVQLNADYDTRDTLKPVMKADISMKNIAVRDAFTTFVIVQKLVPAAKGIEGKIDARLSYSSLLGKDMMPVISTIDGEGDLHSDKVTLVEAPTFDRIKGLLKLGDSYSNTFKDINISFRIKDGRVYVTPFNTKLGNIKMNIGGDQGLDQTLNYLIKTEIPRADLGTSVNSLLDNLSSQASKFGIVYKPADVIKVNVRVSGTFTKPEVMPDFGGKSSGSQGAVSGGTKETVKQVAGDAIDKSKDKLRSEAEAEGDKLIKEAEVRGQQLRDEAARTAKQIRQEADSSAARMIRGAQSKNILAKAAAQKGADAMKKEADKRSNQIVLEADNQAKKLVEDAKKQKEEMIKKI